MITLSMDMCTPMTNNNISGTYAQTDESCNRWLFSSRRILTYALCGESFKWTGIFTAWSHYHSIIVAIKIFHCPFSETEKSLNLISTENIHQYWLMYDQSIRRKYIGEKFELLNKIKYRAIEIFVSWFRFNRLKPLCFDRSRSR